MTQLSSDAFDPRMLQLPPGSIPTFRPSQRPPRPASGQRFLKGPVPWDWILKAAELPGKALFLSMVLWHEVGWRRRRTFKVCLSRVPGLSEYAARRALRRLESANLVAIGRKPGRGLEVTILDVPSATAS